MNTETIERPEIADEVVEARPDKVLTLVNLRTDALAELTAFEAGMAKLHTEHGSTDYDITTPFGMKLATTRRHAIRLVRYAVPKAVKAKRAELNEIRDAVGTEGQRIEAMLQAMEDSHDILIKAEEARKAAIAAEAARVAAEKKAEADRIDAERRAKHEAGISTIKGYLTRCREPGMTSKRIDAGMQLLMGMNFGDEWEEFQGAAHDAKHETLEAMRVLCSAALAREQAEAAAEAQRVENARVAAELEAQRSALAEQAAKMKADAEALQQRMNEQAEREAKAERDAAAVLAEQRAESERLESLAVTQRAALQALEVQGAAIVAAEQMPVGEVIEHQALEAVRIADLTAGTPKPGDDFDPAEDAPVAATPEPQPEPMTLGDISNRLGFAVQQALLAALGFYPLPKGKSPGVRYHGGSFKAICDALIAHITNVKEKN